MSGYFFKGRSIILKALERLVIIPSEPITPAEDGQLHIDIDSKKLKTWNSIKNRWIILGDAEDIIFDNAENGFTATSTQAAIEESKNTAPGFARASITCTFNGTVSNNQWLGYSELLPGNRVPIRLPWNCTLKEISVSYSSPNLLGIPLSSEYVDGSFKIFKNGLTDPTHVVYTNVFTNQLGGKTISNINININADDWIVGKWSDQGDNPSDMAVTYFFQLR